LEVIIEMMTFDEFCSWTENSIKNDLPSDYKDAEIIMHDIGKLGNSYRGMCVMPKGSNTVPTIDLNLFYDAYCSGIDKSTILKAMAKIAQYKHPDLDYEWMTDYSKVRERLYIRLCNAEKNAEVLQTAPHWLYGDIALTCHVIVDTHGDCYGSTMLTNELLKPLDISEEELLSDALENSSRLMLAEFMPIDSLINEISGKEEQSETEETSPYYVLTNSRRINGSAVLFYPGIMELLSEEIGGSYYILPSSVNELMILPDDGITDLEWLEKMVRDVNRIYVDEKDFLSDNVYYYDSRSGQFGLAKELAGACAVQA